MDVLQSEITDKVYYGSQKKLKMAIGQLWPQEQGETRQEAGEEVVKDKQGLTCYKMEFGFHPTSTGKPQNAQECLWPTRGLW